MVGPDQDRVLLFTQLSAHVDEETLITLCGAFGQTQEVEIPLDSANLSPTGRVSFSFPECAKAAQAWLHARWFIDSYLRVAHPGEVPGPVPSPSPDSVQSSAKRPRLDSSAPPPASVVTPMQPPTTVPQAPVPVQIQAHSAAPYAPSAAPQVTHPQLLQQHMPPPHMPPPSPYLPPPPQAPLPLIYTPPTQQPLEQPLNPQSGSVPPPGADSYAAYYAAYAAYGYGAMPAPQEAQPHNPYSYATHNPALMPSHSNPAAKSSVGSSTYSRDADERHCRPPNRELFVFYVTQDVTEQKVREAFAPYGELESVKVPLKNDGTTEHKGFAFVTYKRIEDAIMARDRLQNFKLGTKPLRITFQQ